MSRHADTDLPGTLDAIEQVWVRGQSFSGELPGTAEDQDRLRRLLQEIANAQVLALALSRGDISQHLKGTGMTVGCLKSRRRTCAI